MGTVTDTDGKYTLQASSGDGKIACSYIGYESIVRNIQLSSDTIIDFSMLTSTNELSDVVVLAKSVTDRVRSTQPGMERIDISEMAKTPVIFGERDIIKSLQLLPGVSAEGDGTGGFQVRGGTPSQNLVLLDDAPIINSGHLFGFFSTFNDEALQVLLYTKDKFLQSFRVQRLLCLTFLRNLAIKISMAECSQ